MAMMRTWVSFRTVRVLGGLLAAWLAGPAPVARAHEVKEMTIAARVPDHKKLAPWRFIVLEGEARAQLGEVIAEACIAAEKEPPSKVRLDMERGRLMRAPVVVASFHPSQQNTFTGRLTPDMLEAVFQHAARIISQSS